MVLADEQLPGGGIGLTSVSYTSGTTLWPLSDHLGSVRDLVDNNGRIREHVVYNSFGVRLSESDWDANGNPIASNNPAAVDHLFGYTGREWDSDIELQYNRARWYDPEQGRWKSQDPIGFTAGDVNLYRVVGNHVTGATDPSGLIEVGDISDATLGFLMSNPELGGTFVREQGTQYLDLLDQAMRSHWQVNLSDTWSAPVDRGAMTITIDTHRGLFSRSENSASAQAKQLRAALDDLVSQIMWRNGLTPQLSTKAWTKQLTRRPRRS